MSLRAALPAVVGVVLGLVATLSVLVLPPARDASSDATQFSAARAAQVVARVAHEPHSVVEPAAHARARDAVLSEFTALGLRPQVHTEAVAPDLHPGREVPPVVAAHRLQNIVVRIPGRSERTMLLLAHYDSAPTRPGGRGTAGPGISSGAADDGYGVAAVVETLRALRADGVRPENSLLVVITDGEEVGLLGARAELARHRDEYRQVEWLLNLEARGTSGPALLFETQAGNAAVLGHYLRAAPGSVTSSLMPDVYRLMPNSTDFTPFVQAGFAGINVAAIAGGENYHFSSDDLAHVDTATLQHYGDQALGSVRAWVRDPRAPTMRADADLHAFTVWRGRTVTYPAVVGVVAAVTALLAAGLLLVRQRRVVRWRRVAGTAWAVTWRVLAVGGAAGAVQLALTAWGKMPARIHPYGPDPVMPWLYGCGAVVLVVLLGRVLVTARPGRTGAGREERWFAVIAMYAFGIAVTLAVAPGGSYLFVWPTLLLVVLYLMGRGVRPIGRVGALGAAMSTAFVAFIVTALFGPLVVLMYHAMSVTFVSVPLLFLALPLGPLLLLLAGGDALRAAPDPRS